MLRRGLVVASIAVAATACTLLLPFDDNTAPDASVDASTESAADASRPIVIDAAKEAAPDLSHVCRTVDGGLPISDGWYCGNHGTNVYPGPDSDLLECVEGGIAKTEPCAAGCLFLPSGYPDECNECPGKINGVYCARDFAQWDAGQATKMQAYVVACRDGQRVGETVCPMTCVSGEGGAPPATCK